LDLATESNTRRSFRGQYLLLSDRHLVWFTGDEFDSAGRATGFATARMQLIGARFFPKSRCESLAGWDFERSDTFNS